MHELSLARYRSKDLSQSEIEKIKAEGKSVDVPVINGTEKAIEWNGKLYYFG